MSWKFFVAMASIIIVLIGFLIVMQGLSNYFLQFPAKAETACNEYGYSLEGKWYCVDENDVVRIEIEFSGYPDFKPRLFFYPEPKENVS